MKKTLWVWVVNGTDQEVTDRYDGEQYVFATGRPIEIPDNAAKLIFGWGEDSKYRALQRLGLARTNLDLEAGLARLAKFTFHREDPTRPPHAPVGGADSASDSVSPPESEASTAPTSSGRKPRATISLHSPS